ncbi:MAG: hypothetical protein HZB19_22625 [Chloroflexi bacterium]|nr:hypothetical protein [Chloroflexota bacterium]
MSFTKQNREWLLLSLILAGMAALRLFAYGDLRLSVATNDTASYIESSRAPITHKTLTGSRLFTTNLLFKLMTDETCLPPPFSAPALGTEIYRSRQSCFETIVVIQNVFSIIAWSLLALVLAKRAAGFYSKLLAVTLIPLFGFTPSIADWDSILGSESLTFSLFAIVLAVLMEICFQSVTNEISPQAYFLPLSAIAVFVFWIFTRDVNIYVLVVLLGMAVPLFIFQNLRKQKHLFLAVVVLSVFSIIGLKSAVFSERWKTPLSNVFNDLILPHPAREEFMRSLGMPDPNSPAYEEWFNEKATGAYGRFLLSHPGYAASTLEANLASLFVDNSQPYFLEEKSNARALLVQIGGLLHPTTHLVLFLDAILLINLLVSAFNKNGQTMFIRAWLGLWLFVSASATLFISCFADSIGVARHTLLSVEMFRLMFWIFLIFTIDPGFTKAADKLPAGQPS